MADYENEHCEGCVSWANEDNVCNHDDRFVATPQGRVEPARAYGCDPSCDLFKPSLGCRDTLAAERSAKALETLASCVLDAKGQTIFRSQGPFKP